jgi:hypothetical protein
MDNRIHDQADHDIRDDFARMGRMVTAAEPGLKLKVFGNCSRTAAGYVRAGYLLKQTAVDWLMEIGACLNQDHDPDHIQQILKEAFAGKPNGDGGAGCPGADFGNGETARKISIKTAASLRLEEFDPIRYLVRGYIVEGCTLLAGRPKLGKSWLMLDIGLAVARGDCCLGDIQCEQGDVLFIALEDNERRLQNRITRLIGYGQEWPHHFHYATEWPRADAGGLEEIKKWIASVNNPRLIVVDVLAMFRSPRRSDQQPYEADYAAIQGLQAIASQAGIAIVVVHHLRKSAAEVDPFEKVSGTLALSGAADSVLILDRDAQGTTIYGRGRDIEEIETAVSFSKETCRWRTLGAAAEIRITDERSIILETLRGSKEPLSPLDVADLTGKSHPAIRQMLIRMAADGEIVRASRGRYHHCDSPVGVTDDVTMESPTNSPSDGLSDSPPSTPCHNGHYVTKDENNNKERDLESDIHCDSALPDQTESQSNGHADHQAEPQSDKVTPVTGGRDQEESQATLECWGACTSKRYARPHLVTELAVAFRTGSYTARLCKSCAKPQFSHSYPGGPWWTRAGPCAVCGIEVYLNPSETMHRKKNPEKPILCSSACGREPRLSKRETIHAAREAELKAEQEKADARRKERQRTDQLINDAWPEDEAFQTKGASGC